MYDQISSIRSTLGGDPPIEPSLAHGSEGGYCVGWKGTITISHHNKHLLLYEVQVSILVQIYLVLINR